MTENANESTYAERLAEVQQLVDRTGSPVIFTDEGTGTRRVVSPTKRDGV
jgi:hypothetical protein